MAQTENHYGHETSRLKSFAQTLSSSLIIPSISLALSGFVHPPGVENEQDDCSWCPFCDLKLRFQNAGHNPSVWHQIYSKNCPFLKNNKHVNIRDLGISLQDSSVSSAALPPVVSQIRNRPESYMDHDSFETEYMSAENMNQDDGHITILHDIEATADGDEQNELSSAAELNKLYRSLTQIRFVNDFFYW